MKPCSETEFNFILNVFRQGEIDKNGSFSEKSGELTLTLRAKNLPVFPHRDNFLGIDSGGRIPLETNLEIIADSISKPKWEVYAIHDPQKKTYYYDYKNLYLQSMIEGEPWQNEKEE